MEIIRRRKTVLEADLEESRALLENLSQGPYEMYEFSDTIRRVIQDIDEVMEHAFWQEMVLAEKTGRLMRFEDERKPDMPNDSKVNTGKTGDKC